MTINSKPTVLFTGTPEFFSYAGNEVHHVARVWALDHPLLGEEIVRTSRIVKKNEDGSFETLNTLYVPA